MSRVVSSQLASAIAERVLSLSRVQDRLRALETYVASGEPEPDGQAAAETVLRRALAALSSREGYELGGRLLAGEDVLADGSPESAAALQDLAQAGLAIWDVGSGSSQPTPLLRELLRVLAAAVTDAAAEVKAEQ